MEAGNEVLLNVNSDGLQCTDKMNKCKDAVCLIYAMENENLRLAVIRSEDSITIGGLRPYLGALQPHSLLEVEVLPNGKYSK